MNWYLDDVLRGVFEYADREAQERWQCYAQALGDIRPEDLRDGGGEPIDGIIVGTVGPRPAAAILAAGLPTISVVPTFWPDLPVPQVVPDQAAAGREVARHLIERGFRHFGFTGFAELAFSRERATVFEQVVRAAGGTFATHLDEDVWGTFRHEWETDELTGWVSALPKPVGVMAATDVRARHLLLCCRRAGARVPEDVAIASVDNDDLVCESQRPPISSVPLDGRRAGYAAAAALAALMAGRPPPGGAVVRVPPLPIVCRRSSDVFAIDDADVAAAARFICDRGGSPLTVADVVAAGHLGRRGLERRFRAAIGRSIKDEIARVQVGRAKRLLIETNWPMPRVAAAAGFASAVRFSIAFRRATGATPTSWRDRARLP